MIAVGAYDLRADRQAWWFRARRSALVRTLQRVPPTFGSVLDVGCGTGGNIPTLSHYGPVTGLDSDPWAVMLATGQGHSVLCSDGSTYETTIRYSLVTCLDVLEHVQSTERFLGNLSRLLAPHGLLVVTVPAMPSLWSRHDEHLGHMRRYSKGQLVRELESVGLRVLHASAWGWSILPGQWLTRRLVGRVNGVNDVPMALDWVLGAMVAAELRLPRLSIGSSFIAVAERRTDA